MSFISRITIKIQVDVTCKKYYASHDLNLAIEFINLFINLQEEKTFLQKAIQKQMST